MNRKQLKQNQIKQNQIKQNQIKQNQIKQIPAERNQSKQNQSEQNQSEQNQSEQNLIINMSGINKGYLLGTEKIAVLHDVDFQVAKGEFVAILGPSGSGKTTLMNLLGCMDIADSGEYFLEDQAIHQMPEEEMGNIRNSKIGFIFQNYQLIPTYDILQNIIMPLMVRGMTTKDAEERCMPVIRMLGIDNRLRHRPAELSGGQKQRVSIARALVGEPALLLADEPTGALDSSSGSDVLKLFGQLNEMGNTIVMITHDMNVAKVARRIVHIVDGYLKV